MQRRSKDEYSVEVLVEGKPQSFLETSESNLYLPLPNQSFYTLALYNHSTEFSVDAQINIDGQNRGRARLPPRDRFLVQGPLLDVEGGDKLFRFVKEDSEIARGQEVKVNSHLNGLIEIIFYREIRTFSTLAEQQNQLPLDTYEFTFQKQAKRSPSLWQRMRKLAPKKGPSEEEKQPETNSTLLPLASGVTVLDGNNTSTYTRAPTMNVGPPAWSLVFRLVVQQHVSVKYPPRIEDLLVKSK